LGYQTKLVGDVALGAAVAASVAAAALAAEAVMAVVAVAEHPSLRSAMTGMEAPASTVVSLSSTQWQNGALGRSFANQLTHWLQC
jgi:hypothetical protein